MTDIYVPILYFAGLLFKTVVQLRESSDETMLYTQDENIKLHLFVVGEDVIVEEICSDGEIVDQGSCTYEELIAASSDYAKRLLMESIRAYPRLAMNQALPEIYPVAELGLEHLLAKMA